MGWQVYLSARHSTNPLSTVNLENYTQQPLKQNKNYYSGLSILPNPTPGSGENCLCRQLCKMLALKVHALDMSAVWLTGLLRTFTFLSQAKKQNNFL